MTSTHYAVVIDNHNYRMSSLTLHITHMLQIMAYPLLRPKKLLTPWSRLKKHESHLHSHTQSCPCHNTEDHKCIIPDNRKRATTIATNEIHTNDPQGLTDEYCEGHTSNIIPLVPVSLNDT